MILHIDLDAFYASVEEREDPTLRGKPVAVGGRPEARGVIAAANYAAREFGVHSAMPSAKAVRACPHLVLIKPRGALYAKVAVEIREIFYRYTPLVEPLSLDEAFLDPSGCEKLHGDAVQIGRAIKHDIADELQLVASVGIAANKFLAKLASDWEKPDGFTVIAAEESQAFLDALPVGKIWGVGKAGRAKLQRAGIDTVAQLRRVKPEVLRAQFGSYGERLWQLANGIDERKVEPESEVKSISHETTFAADIDEFDGLKAAALDLTEGVCYRLRRAKLCARTVTVKIRFGDFKTITRARSLPAASDSTVEIWRVAEALLRRELAGRKFAVRLVGVGVSNFDATVQADLLADAGRAKRRKLDALVDEVRGRFGEVIGRG